MQRTLLSRIATVALALLVLALGVPRATAQVNGSVDTNFGPINYWATFDPINGDANVSGYITDLLPLPDGKVLAAGYCTNASFGTGICLYRWTALGFPDNTFGASGASLVKVTTVASPSGTATDPNVRLLRRSNGSIFVAGNCNDTSFGAGICVAAVNANGSGFDTSFGSTGQTFIPRPSGYAQMVLESIALQPDGKLLVGATCYVDYFVNTNASVCVSRLTTGAVFDAAFGTSNWSLTTAGAGDRLRKLVLLPDGRYFALAECARYTQASSYLCSGLFFSNGGFQRTLATDAPNRWDWLLDARVLGSQLTLQWHSQYSSTVNQRIYAARREAYTVAGNYDTSFGGYPSTGVAGDINLDLSNDGYVFGGNILRDGSFLYVGYCNYGSSVPINTFVLCSTRIASNGVLDASYGVGGRFEYGSLLGPWATVGYSGFRPGTPVAETEDGKVLIAGSCPDTFFAGNPERPCVLRLNGSPQTAPTCSMDIDGDGVVNPTTDGLILLRAMFGFSGTSALTNTVGAGAARSTWPQVRDYLFDQCRLPVPVL